MNTTRKQHYVWRYYLKAWCHNKEQIYCLRNGAIYSSNLMGVGVEKDFYEFQTLEPSDITLMTEMIDVFTRSNKANELNTHCKMWIGIFGQMQVITLLDRFLKNKITALEKKQLYDVVKKARIEFEEKIHCHIEFLATPILKKLRGGDISFLKRPGESMVFNSEAAIFKLFVMIQYYSKRRVYKHRAIHLSEL